MYYVIIFMLMYLMFDKRLSQVILQVGIYEKDSGNGSSRDFIPYTGYEGIRREIQERYVN